MIILCGRDCGLTYEENEELVQLVMCEIFQKDILSKYSIDEIPNDVCFKYDPARGRFRHYLKAIIRNQALKLYHKRREFANIEDVPEPVTEESFDLSYEEEWRRLLFNQAMTELKGQVQAETYAAFEMVAVQGRPAKEVADFLGISVNSVYVAKTRCIATLKRVIKELESK